LNVSSDGDDVRVAGKLFHTRAAAAGKATYSLYSTPAAVLFVIREFIDP